MFSFKMKFRPLLRFSRVDERHSFLWRKNVPQLFQMAQIFITGHLQLFPIKKKDAETSINKELHNVVYPPLLTLLKIISRVDQGYPTTECFQIRFEAALKTTYLFGILPSQGNFGHLESLGWFFISSHRCPMGHFSVERA